MILDARRKPSISGDGVLTGTYAAGALEAAHRRGIVHRNVKRPRTSSLAGIGQLLGTPSGENAAARQGWGVTSDQALVGVVGVVGIFPLCCGRWIDRILDIAKTPTTPPTPPN